MDALNLSRAVEIYQGISWVGVTDEQTPFKCNPYVLDDGEEAVLFEPGSNLHYPGVRDKVLQVIQTKKIRYILLSHQDPDLCGSLALWEEYLGVNNVQVVTHSRTAVLLRHYGMKSKPYLVDRNNWTLSLRGGRQLQFIFTPWCHCPGMFMTYDEKTRTLFSGDIFGALTYDWHLYAGNRYTEAMRGFHEDYMASTPHLQAAMAKLKPFLIDRIAPQHGSIIQQNLATHISSLQNLKCGFTLMQGESGAERRENQNGQKGSYQDLIAFVLEREMGVLGEEKALSVAKEVAGLEIDHLGKILTVKGDGKEILGRLLVKYQETFGTWTILNCKLALIQKAGEFKLELPKTA